MDICQGTDAWMHMRSDRWGDGLIERRINNQLADTLTQSERRMLVCVVRVL